MTTFQQAIFLLIFLFVAMFTIYRIGQEIKKQEKQEEGIRRMKMILDRDKIVDFTKCKDCKHEKKAEEEKPCCECLYEPTNINTRKPTKWEEKTK